MIIELFLGWNGWPGRRGRHLKLLGKLAYYSLGQVEVLPKSVHVKRKAVSPVIDFVENDGELDP